MEFINRISIFISQLNDKAFKKYLIIIISTLTLLVFGALFFIYSRSSRYIKEVKQLHQLAEKSTSLILHYDQIQREEDRVEELLNKNIDFNIKTYFEQFCREHHVTPEPNWDTTTNPIEGNEKFEEVILSASFKNETTKTLVTILDALDKNEIVYLTELKIKKEKDKIGFDLVIATKKPRHVLED